MRAIAILVAALAVTACDDVISRRPTSIAFSPTPESAAQFSPQVLPFALVTSSCAVGPVFTTGFNLVIFQERPSFLDHVTLRLLDGTNLGPSITFPRSQLTGMFGSTLVAGSRAFSFQPQFACGLRHPRSLVADVVLTDADGNSRNVSVSAAFQ